MTIEAGAAGAENVQVTKPATKPAAKKTAVKKTAVRTKAVRKLGAVTTTRQPVTPKSAAAKAPAKRARATKPRVAAMQAAPVAAPSAPASQPAKTKRSRPLIALVRRTDSRAVSYGERLAELMHKKFDHVGPVCHRCYTNASQLATVRAAGALVAV